MPILMIFTRKFFFYYNAARALYIVDLVLHKSYESLLNKILTLHIFLHHNQVHHFVICGLAAKDIYKKKINNTKKNLRTMYGSCFFLLNLDLVVIAVC